MRTMFRAIKRLFIFLGLLAERATETDAINEAVVERGIRDNKERAKRANDANGALAGQIGLLKDQLKKQERQRQELQGLLQAAVAANDETDGAHLAEELANLEQDLADNKAQVDNLDRVYKQNLDIVAQSLREIQKFQREFEALKARVRVGKSLEGLAGMMESSVTELQGMMGGELNQSMDQLRQTAAVGEGRMKATLDLASEMGSNIQRQQEARKARGKMLFAEYKKKMGMVQPDAAAAETPATAAPERQKISET
jgi:phage shock protein A